MDTGKLIKDTRIEAGLSQKQMAKELGLSEIHYCGTETGNRRVSLKTLEKIAIKLKKRLVITFTDKD